MSKTVKRLETGSLMILDLTGRTDHGVYYSTSPNQERLGKFAVEVEVLYDMRPVGPIWVRPLYASWEDNDRHWLSVGPENKTFVSHSDTLAPIQ